MRLVRPGIVGAAVLLALHVFMLAGVDIGHPRPATIAVTMDHGEPHDAAAVAPPTPGHPMAVACLAVLAGLPLADEVGGRPAPASAAGRHACGRAGDDTTDPAAHRAWDLPDLGRRADCAARAAPCPLGLGS